MKVATFPESWRNNPFLDLLENSLQNLGVEFQKVGSDYLSLRWILQQRGRIQVLHFHWLQYHYMSNNAFRSWVKLIKFILKVILAKLVGYHIVWTMHNVLPHERRFWRLDHTCYGIFVHLANSIVTLCNNTGLLLNKKYRRHNNVFLGNLGHYLNLYPNEIDQKEARQRLGIAYNRRVFLFFGNVRPYKGVEELIRSFQNLQDTRAYLVIAGKVNEIDYQHQILAAIGNDPRILTALKWIPDEEVQLYFNSCDFVVLPFSEVTTSSTVMLAFCFGKPVIAPAIGCLPEIITPEIGILFSPSQSNSLGEALLLSEELDADKMGERARQSAQRFSWENLAYVNLLAYKAT